MDTGKETGVYRIIYQVSRRRNGCASKLLYTVSLSLDDAGNHISWGKRSGYTADATQLCHDGKLVWLPHAGWPRHQRTFVMKRHAAYAIDIIWYQLSKPGNKGWVWVNYWNRDYNWLLGPFREFVKSHEEFFIVIHISEKEFRVSLKDGA